MEFPSITDRDLQRFQQDGAVLKSGFFDAEEMALLTQAVATDSGIAANVVALKDSAGGTTELALWNHPGDDLFGAFARVARMVEGMERLLGGEVYHYHSKLTMKRPHAGGAWDWHQDYGYWYHNGCLFPDLASVAIAVDPATRENGCLEILKGSHRLGRISHGRVGGQTGADTDRVAHAAKVLEHAYVEMEPGDALFFHCNTLHASRANRSGKPRSILLCCYNRASSNPVKAHHHPFYTPLDKLPDTAIKEMGLRLEPERREFFDPEQDKTVEAERLDA